VCTRIVSTGLEGINQWGINYYKEEWGQKGAGCTMYYNLKREEQGQDLTNPVLGFGPITGPVGRNRCPDALSLGLAKIH